MPSSLAEGPGANRAEASRDVGGDVGAVVEMVGFDAAEGVQADGQGSTWPTGFRNRDNYRLRKLLTGGDSTSPTRSK